MGRSYTCLLFLVIFCIVHSVMVRMTDRKPKWAVGEAKSTSKPETVLTKEEQVIPPPDDTRVVKEDEEKQQQEPAVDIEQISRKRAPLEFSGPSALSPLQGICTQFDDGHYTYHVCPYQYVMQVENQDGGYRGCIGIWGSYTESPYQQSEVRMQFNNGESCPGSIERQTELIISCDHSVVDSLEIHSVNEKEMCHYMIEGASSYVCNINPEEMPPDFETPSRVEQRHPEYPIKRGHHYHHHMDEDPELYYEDSEVHRLHEDPEARRRLHEHHDHHGRYMDEGPEAHRHLHKHHEHHKHHKHHKHPKHHPESYHHEHSDEPNQEIEIGEDGESVPLDNNLNPVDFTLDSIRQEIIELREELMELQEIVDRIEE